MEEKKKLEVVSGDGSNLNISPVYEHIDAGKPKSSDKKPTNIVIPKETTKAGKDTDNQDEDNEKKEEN